MVVGKRAEYPFVHADNADHYRTSDVYQTGVVDGRDSGNRCLASLAVVFDDRSRTLGIEGVAHPDWNVS